jgi:hypothetical protein
MKDMENMFQLKMNLMEKKYEGNNHALQKELTDLKRKELQHYKENKQLKERLAKMEAGIDDGADNDLNYDSPDYESDDGTDINYDSECSNIEKQDDKKKTTTNTHQNENQYHSVETYADPNYNSSDNEDPRNDIYLD